MAAAILITLLHGSISKTDILKNNQGRRYKFYRVEGKNGIRKWTEVCNQSKKGKSGEKEV